MLSFEFYQNLVQTPFYSVMHLLALRAALSTDIDHPVTPSVPIITVET